MSNEPIIQALIARRKAAGVNQEEAASMAGLSLKTYQRIENGTADIRLKNYLALIRNLKVTDLDVALDALGIAGATPWDVAAAARVLPPEARAALVSMIMIIYRDVIDNGGKN
jgi:transcriptional regulator with XRE-family HTH domain